MNDIIIPAPTGTQIFRGGPEGPVCEAVVRVYRHTPGSLQLQIRANGPTDALRRGKPRATASDATLDIHAARDLIAALESAIASITDVKD